MFRWWMQRKYNQAILGVMIFLAKRLWTGHPWLIEEAIEPLKSAKELYK